MGTHEEYVLSFQKSFATYLELIKRNLKTQNHGDKNNITIRTLQGMTLSDCLINCIYMQIAVASVCGQFDRLCLDCIHGQETPSSPGSERQQAVMDFYRQLWRSQPRTMECVNRSQAKIWHTCIHEQKFAVATLQLSSIVAYKQTMYVLCFFRWCG